MCFIEWLFSHFYVHFGSLASPVWSRKFQHLKILDLLLPPCLQYTIAILHDHRSICSAANWMGSLFVSSPVCDISFPTFIGSNFQNLKSCPASLCISCCTNLIYDAWARRPWLKNVWWSRKDHYWTPFVRSHTWDQSLMQALLIFMCNLLWRNLSISTLRTSENPLHLSGKFVWRPLSIENLIFKNLSCSICLLHICQFDVEVVYRQKWGWKLAFDSFHTPSIVIIYKIVLCEHKCHQSLLALFTSSCYFVSSCSFFIGPKIAFSVPWPG